MCVLANSCLREIPIPLFEASITFPTTLSSTNLGRAGCRPIFVSRSLRPDILSAMVDLGTLKRFEAALIESEQFLTSSTAFLSQGIHDHIVEVFFLRYLFLPFSLKGKGNLTLIILFDNKSSLLIILYIMS